MTKSLELFYRPGLLIVWLLLLLGGFTVIGAQALQSLRLGATPIASLLLLMFTAVGILYILRRLLTPSKPALVADIAGISYRGGANRIEWRDVREFTLRREMMITYLRLRYAASGQPGKMRSVDLCLSGLSLPPEDIAIQLRALKENSAAPKPA
ncbi:hypothetical protein [Rhizobium sp. FKL33]|uniref:hypothetical protein n=1 Tax=Rhizobium sp. FKL33 TaxID=2562307 RepID=UPI0010BF6768|nr:hypothetical protein [Rhizobium sp. FKL33]